LGYVRKVLKEDTYDPAANFMYGTIKRRVDELTQAREAFGWAARSMKYRSAGFTQMAELYLMEDHFDDAIYYARKALAFNTNNMAARQTRAAAHRLLGENEKASREIDDILTTDPLNHFGRFERYLLNPDTKNRKQFTSLIRNEMPHETYLELAIRYAELHRVEAARKVLELAPRDPMVHYWQAYLHRENSEKRDEYLRKAANQSPRLVYPFRSESMEVLQWAMGQWEQWQSTYYLGLIMWHKGRKEQAVDLLMACQSQPQFLPFYLTRGQVMKDKNPRQAGKDFRHALSMDEEKWRPYRALGQWYVRQGAIEKAVPLLERAHEKFADNYYIGMLYASVLNKNQQYSEALEVLEQLTVLPYEGAQRGHQLYEHAHLMLALEKLVSDKYREASDHIAESLKWPEHLGAGRPYDPDNRFQDYLEAIIYEHKNEEQSTTLFDAILAYSKDHWSDIKAGEFTKDNFVSYQVLRDLGRDQKADHLRNQFEQKLGEEKVNALTLGKEANSEIGNDASGNEDLRWFNLLRKISSDN
jgi:Tfp pilus assembly protein PilF